MESDYRSYIKQYVFGLLLLCIPLLWPVEVTYDPFVHFMQAIEQDDTDTFKQLQNHVLINQQDANGVTPLLCSILTNSSSCFNLLLNDIRIDVNGVSATGAHPLILSASLGLVDFVTALLDAEDINVNYQDNDGCTALHRAIESQNLEVLSLVGQKVSIDIKNDKGNTALMHTLVTDYIPFPKKIRMVRYLILRGADPYASNNKGLHPYGKASKKLKRVMEPAYLDTLVAATGSPEMKLELERIDHMDINALDEIGLTPLMRAIILRNSDLVTAFINDPRLNINVVDAGGRTALYYAAWDGSLDYVEQIMDLPDVDLNRADRSGYTPLMRAVKGGHKKVIKYLLRKGADPWLRTRRGRHALGLASEEIQNVILAILSELRELRRKQRREVRKQIEKKRIERLRGGAGRARDFLGRYKPSEDSREFKSYGD